MKVEIRIYRRHDADLMMLPAYGINITRMMRKALENYVAGKRVKYTLPYSKEYDISDRTMLRYRFEVRNSAVIALLRSIKRSYRNQFCKALLRDMLDSEPLGVFFDLPEYVEKETSRLLSAETVSDDLLDAGQRKQKTVIKAMSLPSEGTEAEVVKAEKPVKAALVKKQAKENKKEEKKPGKKPVYSAFQKTVSPPVEDAEDMMAKQENAEDMMAKQENNPFASLEFAPEQTDGISSEEQAQRNNAEILSVFKDMLKEAEK